MQKLRSTRIAKQDLYNFYVTHKMSMQKIANRLGCSLNKVDYWMRIHKIPRRARSEAGYIVNHPNGDPFAVRKPQTTNDYFLYGLGIGLYLGEGNKMNKNAIRLGNTDPYVITSFIEFLTNIYGVKKSEMRFGLQVFNDVSSVEAKEYWLKILGVNSSQFYKTTVTISGAIGTYRRKNRYGVLTVYYHNTKLRNILMKSLRSMPR